MVTGHDVSRIDSLVDSFICSLIDQVLCQVRIEQASVACASTVISQDQCFLHCLFPADDTATVHTMFCLTVPNFVSLTLLPIFTAFYHINFLYVLFMCQFSLVLISAPFSFRFFSPLGREGREGRETRFGSTLSFGNHWCFIVNGGMSDGLG